MAESEGRMASRLSTWMRQPPAEGLRLSTESAGGLVRQHSRDALTSEQRTAIQSLLTGSRLVVLTGGPGTGKTTTMRTLILCLESLQVPYALCATTGRAAKQLAFATDRQAATVHRHLGLGPRTEQMSPEAMPENVLIIDEASMIDLWLMDQIVARLGDHTHLFLVGDIDQLPPVGPGAVLHDLIEASHQMPVSAMIVVCLEQIFRQEAGDVSLIVANCHRIRRGERPVRPSGPTSDYFEMPRESPREALELAVELAAHRLPQYLHIPPGEVQVLTPVHGGEAGVQALNAALQARLNPPAPRRNEHVLGRHAQGEAVVLRVGDKVRQTRNDYQKRVFNGDLGTVVDIDSEEQAVRVRFDDSTVEYAFAELDDLVHSWAMTVHAAQGSQWPAVIVIMLASHYVMLERNILYTALSRAQRMAVLISQERALHIAVQRTTLVTRRTDLVARLHSHVSGALS
ncbi:MAG: AAA family ATPase [Anaerolineae bacterium]